MVYILHPRASVIENVEKMINCGDPSFGGAMYGCPTCGNMKFVQFRCHSRFCPTCGNKYSMERTTRMSFKLINVTHRHCVFTIDENLRPYFLKDRSLLNCLFHAVTSVVTRLFHNMNKSKNFTPGFIMVLHTFGRDLKWNPHIHMLISGGGLTQDKTSFIRLREGQFFLPAKLLASRYRSIYMSSLKQLRDDNTLSYSGHAQKYRNSYEWKELVDKCYGTDWNVEIKPYPPSQGSCTRGDDPKKPSNAAGAFADYAMKKMAAPARIPGSTDTSEALAVQDPPGIDAVHQYMAQYTNRTAVTDDRILSCSSTSVVIECKVHHRGGYTTKEPLNLSPDEFIRRLLLNILPKGFARTRFAGFLAGCVKARNLALIRELLDQEQPLNPTKEMKAAELVLFFYGNDFSLCPACHVPMKVLGHRLGEGRATSKIRAS